MPAQSQAIVEAELLKWADLARVMNVSTSAVWSMHRDGRLGPLPLRFGPRCSRFRRQEVLDWIVAGSPPRNEWQARQLASRGGRR